MKKIIINVVSAVVIIMIMAIANRLTITETTHVNRSYWGDGRVEGTLHVERRLALTGEILSVEESDYEYREESLARFFEDANNRTIKLGFR